MIPVDQDRFYNKEKGLRGNCMQAAVASLLELPLDAVPNFIEEGDHSSSSFWSALFAFLRQRGFEFIEFHGDGIPEPDCFYLAHGPAPRGVSHTVVYRDGRLAHDPHPTRAGLDKVESITVLIPRNPAKLKP